MDATLNLYFKLLAFCDKTINSNPRLRPVDWDREVSGVPVSDAQCSSSRIAVDESKTFFDGTRATSIDGTSVLSISLLTTGASSYRITSTGGTAPAFRTGRGLTMNGCVVTFTVGANNAVTLSVPALSPSDFTPVLAGDILFIPHTTTGDSANVISTMNAGYWKVLSKNSNTNLSISRLDGTTFEGVTETILITNNNQIRAFGTSGLQIGDSVRISAGFAASTQKTFTITN